MVAAMNATLLMSIGWCGAAAGLAVAAYAFALRRRYAAALAQVEESREPVHRCRNALQLMGVLARLQAGASHEAAVQAALHALDARQAAVARALNLSLQDHAVLSLHALGVEAQDEGTTQLRLAPYAAMRLAVLTACLGRMTAQLQGDVVTLTGRPTAGDSMALSGLVAESFGGDASQQGDGAIRIHASVAALTAVSP